MSDQVACDGCNGKGVIAWGNGPWEKCPARRGTGKLDARDGK